MIITIIHWKNCILKQKKNDSSFFSCLFLRKSPFLASLCHLLSLCHKKDVLSDTLIVQTNQYKNIK